MELIIRSIEMSNTDTQLDELRRIVREVYTPFYADINDTVEEGIVTFAERLYAKKIIGRAVMKTNNYRKIISEFQAGLTWLKSIKDIEDYCQNFIDALAVLEGQAAVGAAKDLKKGWSDAVWERQRILFLRDEQREYFGFQCNLVKKVFIIVLYWAL